MQENTEERVSLYRAAETQLREDKMAATSTSICTQYVEQCEHLAYWRIKLMCIKPWFERPADKAASQLKQ